MTLIASDPYSAYAMFRKCTRKVRYASQGRAETTRQMGFPTKQREDMKVYFCTACTGWHIGHRRS